MSKFKAGDKVFINLQDDPTEYSGEVVLYDDIKNNYIVSAIGFGDCFRCTETQLTLKPDGGSATVETVLPDPGEVLSVNTVYDAGRKELVVLRLPEGKVGDFIEVDFITDGGMPTIFDVECAKTSYGLKGLDLIPGFDKIYSLYFSWMRFDSDYYGWAASYVEYDVH